jgi:hypothetical protein
LISGVYLSALQLIVLELVFLLGADTSLSTGDTHSPNARQCTFGSRTPFPAIEDEDEFEDDF